MYVFAWLLTTLGGAMMSTGITLESTIGGDWSGLTGGGAIIVTLTVVVALLIDLQDG